jgi:hypothetical protein
MITAHSFGEPGAILVELIFPNNQPTQYGTVSTPGEVQRLKYFHKRKYIIEKLQRWLRQRKMALLFSPDASKINDVVKLQGLLAYYEQASLATVCKSVSIHSDLYKSLAPGNSSKLFNYYANFILPILFFCDEPEL